MSFAAFANWFANLVNLFGMPLMYNHSNKGNIQWGTLPCLTSNAITKGFSGYIGLFPILRILQNLLSNFSHTITGSAKRFLGMTHHWKVYEIFKISKVLNTHDQTALFHQKASEHLDLGFCPWDLMPLWHRFLMHWLKSHHQCFQWLCKDYWSTGRNISDPGTANRCSIRTLILNYTSYQVQVHTGVGKWWGKN